MVANTGTDLEAELALALHEGHAVPQPSTAALAVGSQPHIVVRHDCTEISGQSVEREAYWCPRRSPRREGSTDRGAASSARGSRSLKWCEPRTEQDHDRCCAKEVTLALLKCIPPRSWRATAQQARAASTASRHITLRIAQKTPSGLDILWGSTRFMAKNQHDKSVAHT